MRDGVAAYGVGEARGRKHLKDLRVLQTRETLCGCQLRGGSVGCEWALVNCVGGAQRMQDRLSCVCSGVERATRARPPVAVDDKAMVVVRTAKAAVRRRS